MKGRGEASSGLVLPGQDTRVDIRCPHCQAVAEAEVKSTLVAYAASQMPEREKRKYESVQQLQMAVAQYVQDISEQVCDRNREFIDDYVDPDCSFCGGTGYVSSVPADQEQWAGVVVGCEENSLLCYGDQFPVPHMDPRCYWIKNPYGTLGFQDWKQRMWLCSDESDVSLSFQRGMVIVGVPEDSIPMITGNIFDGKGGQDAA